MRRFPCGMRRGRMPRLSRQGRNLRELVRKPDRPAGALVPAGDQAALQGDQLAKGAFVGARPQAQPARHYLVGLSAGRRDRRHYDAGTGPQIQPFAIDVLGSPRGVTQKRHPRGSGPLGSGPSLSSPLRMTILGWGLQPMWRRRAPFGIQSTASVTNSPTHARFFHLVCEGAQCVRRALDREWRTSAEASNQAVP